MATFDENTRYGSAADRAFKRWDRVMKHEPQALTTYHALTPDDFVKLHVAHGPEQVAAYIRAMEKLKDAPK